VTARQWPPETEVEVRYPLTDEAAHGDREAWPWLPGWIAEVCGPDEWQVCVQAPELGRTEDGRVPPPGTPAEDLLFPLCFRDSSEIRARPVAG
jgi:hypothetical protein